MAKGKLTRQAIIDAAGDALTDFLLNAVEDAVADIADEVGMAEGVEVTPEQEKALARDLLKSVTGKTLMRRRISDWDELRATYPRQQYLL